MLPTRPLSATAGLGTAAICLLLTCLSAAPVTAQESQQTVVGQESYLMPPEPVAEALRAPWHRNAELEDPAPDADRFVVERRDRRMPPLSLLSRNHHHLGGLQVDPTADRVRDATTESHDGMWLVSAEDADTVEVEVPGGAKVSSPTWSPDGDRLAFAAHFDDATGLYVADAATGDSRRVTDRPLLFTLSTDLRWSADGRYLFAVLVPEDRGAEPVEPEAPTTPRVDLTTEGDNVLRTFPDLLETPHERALLEHYGTGQLARIEVDGGGLTEIGEPALIDGVDPSPDGSHAVVSTLRRPFPKIVPVYRFSRLEEIWDEDGRVLAEVEERPVRDGAEDDGEEDRRREVAWRPDGEGLGFLEREPAPGEDDGGDTETRQEDGEDEEERTDRVMRWLPPYDSASLEVVHESEGRLSDLAYSDDGETLFLTEDDPDSEEERIVAVYPDRGTSHVVASHDPDDPYDDPGDLVTLPARPDAPVARVSPDGAAVYLEGTVYSEDPLEEAPRPFLDRVEITTGEANRLFESSEDAYEQVVEVLDDDARRMLLSRESRDDVPDYFVRELESGAERALTANRDYAPEVTGARREALWAERADGLEFKVEVTLPRGYEGEEPLPAVFWHYPREYEGEEDYSEGLRFFNRNAFPAMYPRSMDKLTRLGYAVVEPDVPILGPSEDRWNDYYVAHLRNSHSAAIDAVAERGWIDRERLAVGGHSYGGFGTINSMIQTPYFKAGLAGAANSNRSLTPAGFQREPRTLWEARETYTRMSPLFWVNELNGALLLYHGLDDQNVGTFPNHSERSYHALNALGKTAALYMYPYEGHGPEAEESVMDLWARWAGWLDEHVVRADEEEGEEASP